ncbi:hypothetical protein GCM10027427_35040 [Pseudoclavibacter terrae]
MPNVVRGDRFAGLMTYLVGPGRANEHEEPHLVAGDGALMAWYDEAELSRENALGIAKHLDQPRTAFGVEVAGGHVWHCSLSLRADEGQLTDEQWNRIATDFVSAMGFDDHEGTKAPCRWVAVRHGVSTNGNDHIHLAVNLVREDGTKTSFHHDYYRAQQAARALEVRYGLEELESVREQRATRGYNPAEREAQARARARARHERERATSATPMPAWDALSGSDRQARIAVELRLDEPRHVLAVRVRAAFTAAESEGEFVRRMRRSGLLVRPRFAEGRTDVVTGYSVAERPTHGERPIWYGGGQLGRDLTLPRLRAAWPDSPTGASEAAAEWNAAFRGKRIVAPGREMHEPDPQLWAQRERELEDTVRRVREVPLEDRDTWAQVARQTSGVFAAWSVATEPVPGDLAAASEALSRSAQTYRRPLRESPAVGQSIAGAAMLFASATRAGNGPVAQLAMMRQLLRLTQAVHDAAKASEQARHAQLLATDTRARLVRVRNALPAPETPTLEPVAQQRATATVEDIVRASRAKPAAEAASTIPKTLEPEHRVTPTRAGPDPDRGIDR